MRHKNFPFPLAKTIFLLVFLLLIGCQEAQPVPPAMPSGEESVATATAVPISPTATNTPEAPIIQVEPTETAVFPGLMAHASTTTDVALGELATDGAALKISAGALAEEVAIAMQTDPAAETIPPADPAAFTLIGSPLIVTADGGHTRLDAPITITFQVPESTVTAEEWQANTVWIAYYDGQAWNYLPPTTSDQAAGTVTLDTYHLSLLGYGKVSVEERIKQYTHSQAISNAIQSNIADEAVNQMVAQTVDHILTEKLGISDEALTHKILTSLANDDAYRDLINQFNAGDVEGFSQTMAVFAGQKIVEVAGESVLSKALSQLTSESGVDLVAGAGQAAGYLAEGQFREAGRILGEKIADQFLITTITKGAAEVVQYQIDTWKDAEIEAAYQAYKNGADGVFWGYNVDPGDFDAVWGQMRGIATRLQSEAVEREIQRRANLGLPEATAAEFDTVRQGVHDKLKEQFETRSSSEAELAENEKQIAGLIEAMQAANLLESNRFGFDPAYDTLETRLDKLMHLSRKILRDTGRLGWTDGASSTEKAISTADMIGLMQAWYSTDGKQLYADMLRDKFGIVIPPPVTAENLSGAWLMIPGAPISDNIVCQDGILETEEGTETVHIDKSSIIQLVTWINAAGDYRPDTTGTSLTWGMNGNRLPDDIAAYTQAALQYSGTVQPGADKVQMQTTFAWQRAASQAPLQPKWSPLLLGLAIILPGAWSWRRKRPHAGLLTLFLGLFLLTGCLEYDMWGTVSTEAQFTEIEYLGGETVPTVTVDALPDAPPLWKLNGTIVYDINFSFGDVDNSAVATCTGTATYNIEARIYKDLIVDLD